MYLSCHRYGAILEKFQNKDPSLMGRIRGCIVDSAPVASPDPQVNGACNGLKFAINMNNGICYIVGIVRYLII